MESEFGANQSVHLSEFPNIESSNMPAAGNQIIKKASKVANMNGPGATDLNTSIASVSMRYRHENQNSIYYLKPNSVDIYFLDFRLQGFVKEQMRWNRGRNVLPTQMNSIQTTDANIFVIGGTRAGTSGQTVLQDTLQIDANLTVYDKEPMKTGRYHTPLALIRDRFILALGGFTGRQ